MLLDGNVDQQNGCYHPNGHVNHSVGANGGLELLPGREVTRQQIGLQNRQDQPRRVLVRQRAATETRNAWSSPNVPGQDLGAPVNELPKDRQCSWGDVSPRRNAIARV